LKVAEGWGATPVLSGLSTPRGIIIDSAGHLLVMERGVGITGHTLDANGCVTDSKVIVDDKRLNHAVDVVGSRLVARYGCFAALCRHQTYTLLLSSSDIAWSWEYDAAKMEVTNRKTLVTGYVILYLFNVRC
jgi:hypothetical protein